ncbi:hypothetical protein EDD18DRAFT_1112604 [Armillaria luteobubalina]|uniref:Uncharacterized protein n=1 Tax=Armillaria luteobubalina TaxID=153913 RepID=A0AA39TE22_9AGAR|nr:hypothetical protein EDD18DRAFT_1112604 [Armillaria luteobubalina]
MHIPICCLGRHLEYKYEGGRIIDKGKGKEEGGGRDRRKEWAGRQRITGREIRSHLSTDGDQNWSKPLHSIQVFHTNIAMIYDRVASYLDVPKICFKLCVFLLPATYAIASITGQNNTQDTRSRKHADGDVKSGGRCGIIDMECREVGSAIMKGMVVPAVSRTISAVTCEYAPLLSTVRSTKAEKAVPDLAAMSRRFSQRILGDELRLGKPENT